MTLLQPSLHCHCSLIIRRTSCELFPSQRRLSKPHAHTFQRIHGPFHKSQGPKGPPRIVTLSGALNSIQIHLVWPNSGRAFTESHMPSISSHGSLDGPKTQLHETYVVGINQWIPASRILLMSRMLKPIVREARVDAVCVLSDEA